MKGLSFVYEGSILVFPFAIESNHTFFEGVCVTTVILTPGACGLGLRAALLATTSPAPPGPAAPAAPAAVFQKAPIGCYLQYLRARGPLRMLHPFFLMRYMRSW